MDMDIKPPKSISDQIYEYLKAQILNGELHPNERLTQKRVAEQLNVSHMPMREAFRLLEQDGLVERLLQGGLKVTSVTLETIGHVLGTRAALEAYGIELACDRISEAEIAKLEGIKHRADNVLNQDSLSRSEKAKLFFELNTEFHDTIYEATGNPYLIKFISQLRNLVLRMRAIGLREVSGWIQIWEEHGQLLESLKRKDKETARRCIKRHIENAASYTITVVKMEESDNS
jgi:DNA-binding GntR family transcriptional regulator